MAEPYKEREKIVSTNSMRQDLDSSSDSVLVGGYLTDRNIFLDESAKGQLVSRHIFDFSQEKEGSYSNVAALKRFLSSVSVYYRMDFTDLEKDPEFVRAFFRLLDLELNVKERNVALQEYSKLKVFVQSKILTRLNQGDVRFRKGLYKTYTALERDRFLGHRINSFYSKVQDPNKIAAFERWQRGRSDYNKRLLSGEISLEDHLKQTDELDAEVINVSGDEGLKEICEDYKKDEQGAYDNLLITSEEMLNSQIANGDQPVLDQSAVDQALAMVNGDVGMEISFSSGNFATVIIDDDLPVDISIFRNRQSGEIIYYLTDKYAENGFVRVKSDELLSALDYRHIDAYLSGHINRNAKSDELESARDIPDKYLVTIAQKLLGDSSTRGFTFSDQDKLLLDGLSEVLVLEDDQYLTLSKKIDGLLNFLESGENIAKLRAQLLSRKFTKVSELIGS